MDCIFCKIANHEMPKEFVFEDEDVMVFPDINPIMETHLLVVPKKHLKDFLELEDDSLTNKLRSVLQRVAKEKGLEASGYRIIANGGGAQIIDHLHFHLIGPMGHKAKL